MGKAKVAEEAGGKSSKAQVGGAAWTLRRDVHVPESREAVLLGPAGCCPWPQGTYRDPWEWLSCLKVWVQSSTNTKEPKRYKQTKTLFEKRLREAWGHSVEAVGQ